VIVAEDGIDRGRTRPRAARRWVALRLAVRRAAAVVRIRARPERAAGRAGVVDAVAAVAAHAHRGAPRPVVAPRARVQTSRGRLAGVDRVVPPALGSGAHRRHASGLGAVLALRARLAEERAPRDAPAALDADRVPRTRRVAHGGRRAAAAEHAALRSFWARLAGHAATEASHPGAFAEVGIAHRAARAADRRATAAAVRLAGTGCRVAGEAPRAGDHLAALAAGVGSRVGRPAIGVAAAVARRAPVGRTSIAGSSVTRPCVARSAVPRRIITAVVAAGGDHQTQPDEDERSHGRRGGGGGSSGPPPPGVGKPWPPP
jgi:hypothetical protein